MRRTGSLQETVKNNLRTRGEKWSSWRVFGGGCGSEEGMTLIGDCLVLSIGVWVYWYWSLGWVIGINRSSG
jgi:hypothetical protein